MSLPPAPKDVSDHPIAGSVVDPVDKRLKDADVDRKIRLYGVIQAFRQGRMPDNKQIDEALKYLEEHSPVDLDKLSTEGGKLIQDFRDIIETARIMVKEKNHDELFQNFVWHTRDVSLESIKKGEAISPDEQKAHDQAQQALRHIRTIVSLVLTNAEVRKLLSDFSILGRDLLAKGAEIAAEKLRPGEEELAHVDEPAPQDEFITKGGRKAAPNETPILDVRLPGTDTTFEQHPHADEPTISTSEDDVKSGSRAVQEGRAAVSNVQGQASQAKDEVQDLVEQEAQGGSGVATSSKDADPKKQGIKERILGVREGISDRFYPSQQDKDRVHEQVERGKKFFSQDFPEERREQFIYRAKKVIIECQKHDDYQEAIKWLLSYVEEQASDVMEVTDHGKETGLAIASDPALSQAAAELRTLLERFANGQSMNIIFDAINAIVDDARRDEEFRTWFRRLHAYMRKVLLEAGYVLEDECNREGNEIREAGRKFWDEKYRSHFDNLFDVTSTWLSAMANDPLNKRFGEDWARLTRDLLFDSEGSLKFKTDLWADIRKVILPTLVDKVGYIPIPRIEYCDESLELVVENLTLQGRNLFPNYLSMEAHNFLKFSPYNTITDVHHHEFVLTFGQMQADMRDIAFYFRKKTGIPKLSDSGLADVILGGEGLTATVHLVSSDKDRSSVFKVKNVHVKVDTLKFSIRDSKHDLLYKTLKPLATRLVKKQIQKAIADAITTGMEYVDGQLVSVRDRMKEAEGSDETDRRQALQDMFKRKKDESQQSKPEKTVSHFKVVHSARESMIRGGHPAGWVNRAVEIDEKVVTGKDWRSEAFAIV